MARNASLRIPRLTRPCVLVAPLFALVLLALSPASAGAAGFNGDFGTAVNIANDGSNDVIAVGGTAPDGATESQVAVTRRNDDGSDDAGFGGGDGEVTITISPGGGFAIDLDFEPDGDIVIVVQRTDGNIEVIKLNPDGSPDTDCGPDGSETIDLGGNDVPAGIAVDVAAIWLVGEKDGKGFVIHVDADCTQNTGAGTTILEVAAGVMNDVVDIAVNPGGSAYIVGEFDPQAGIFKVGTNLAISNTFGDGDGTDNDGVRLDNLSLTSFDFWRGVQLVGTTLHLIGDNASDLVAATRDTTSGTVVGTDQAISHAGMGAGEGAAGLARREDGNFLAGGSIVSSLTAADAIVTVFDPNNALVNAFDTDGKLTIDAPAPGQFNLGTGATTLPGSKGVVLGFGHNPANDSDDMLISFVSADGSSVITTAVDFTSGQGGGPGGPGGTPSQLAEPRTFQAGGGLAQGATVNHKFITAAYSDMIGRLPAPQEARSWVSILRSGAATRAEVVQAIEQTPEARGRLVASFYQNFLNRDPTDDENRLWVTELDGAGTTTALATALASSEEYVPVAAGFNGGWVKRAYGDIVGREPSQAELDATQGLLDAGQSRADAALSLLSSPEYKNFVVSGYANQFLGREPTKESLTQWLRAFTGGGDETSVIQALVGSAEYFNARTGFKDTAKEPKVSADGRRITVETSFAGEITLEVSELRPGALPLGKASAGGARTSPVSVPKLKRVGTVRFGRKKAGRVKLRWNQKVKGKTLKPGRYSLRIRVKARGRPEDVSEPVRIKIKKRRR